jgi:hypothetical protein
MYCERKGSILLNVRGLRGIIKGAETAPGVPYDSPKNPKKREGTAEVRRPMCTERLGGAGKPQYIFCSNTLFILGLGIWEMCCLFFSNLKFPENFYTDSKAAFERAADSRK